MSHVVGQLRGVNHSTLIKDACFLQQKVVKIQTKNNQIEED